MKSKNFIFFALAFYALSAQASDLLSDEALVFGYCGPYASAIGANDFPMKTAEAAIEIPQEQSESWEGALLTKINIGVGYVSSNEVTVFLTENLEVEPFYTQTAKISQQNGWNLITLETPFEINGHQFFVGYTTNINSNERAIGIDGVKTDVSYGSYVNLYNEWENVSKFYGSVCIRLYLTGDNLPQYSVEASTLEVPELVVAETPFTGNLYVTNGGLKTITSIDISCKIDGKEVDSPKSVIPTTAIPSGEMGLIEIPELSVSSIGKDRNIEVTILKVNGYDDESPNDNIVTASINCAEKVFLQQITVEEFTGTWCGFCPIGIVGMEYMKEHYGDIGFNGIAVHCGQDPMTITQYIEISQKLSKEAYPSAIVNREIYFTNPSIETLERYYLELTKLPAPAAVNLTASYFQEENVINVVSEAEFSFDEEDAPYAMAYVIVENNVGPYTQTNYFYDGAYGNLEGWENKPYMANDTYYNEVAKLIETAYGISESIPQSITALTPYKYETALSCENVKNIAECEVIALLLNTETGYVVNSAKAHIENAEAGVESIDKNNYIDKISVYNLQGIKVLETKNSYDVRNLPSGIYIVNGEKVVLN